MKIGNREEGKSPQSSKKKIGLVGLGILILIGTGMIMTKSKLTVKNNSPSLKMIHLAEEGSTTDEGGDDKKDVAIDVKPVEKEEEEGHVNADLQSFWKRIQRFLVGNKMPKYQEMLKKYGFSDERYRGDRAKEQEEEQEQELMDEMTEGWKTSSR